MKSPPDPLLIHARAVWVHGRELRLDCSLLLRDGAIEAIVGRRDGEKLAADSAYRMIEADLAVPGLINAHCHLEYSALEGQLPRGPIPFGEWLDAIVASRGAEPAADARTTITEGAMRLARGGCTCVIDSLSNLDLLPEYNQVSIRHFVLFEVLGLSETRAEEVLAPVKRRLGDAGGCTESPLWLGEGINPHSPYSVGGYLRQYLVALLAKYPDLACAWHLAETPDETELLEAGRGSIAEFLGEHGLPHPVEPMGEQRDGGGHSAPVRYLQDSGLWERCDLAFHGNEFQGPDWSAFAAPRGIVHCPGTHQYFDRPPFPMVEALFGGVNVCLGTDSLASSDSLSMWDVLKQTADLYPALGGGQLLDLATRNPARTRLLANAHRPLGILAPGAAADLVLLHTPTQLSQPLREILNSTEIHATIVAGEMVL